MGEVIQGPWKGDGLFNLPKFLLAREENVSVRQVERWLKNDCPHKLVDGNPRFCLNQVRQWRAEQERRAS